MKCHEIVVHTDQACRDNNTHTDRALAKSKELGRKRIEEAINRLYTDLMEALENRMMNVGPEAEQEARRR
jgi:hypothetical protein